MGVDTGGRSLVADLLFRLALALHKDTDVPNGGKYPPTPQLDKLRNGDAPFVLFAL